MHNAHKSCSQTKDRPQSLVQVGATQMHGKISSCLVQSLPIVMGKAYMYAMDTMQVRCCIHLLTYIAVLKQPTHMQLLQSLDGPLLVPFSVLASCHAIENPEISFTKESGSPFIRLQLAMLHIIIYTCLEPLLNCHAIIVGL